MQSCQQIVRNYYSIQDERALKNFISMYRLVLIIANEFYQYYREWQPNSKKIDTRAIELAAEAHRIWSSGDGVQEIRLEDGRRAWRVVRLE